MQLDKRHMYASIGLMVCAVSYNVWVFTRPAASTGATAAAPPAAPVTAPGGVGGAGTPTLGPLDPTQVKPLADVALDRLPEWPRDPFNSLRVAEAPEVIETVDGGPAPVADPDPVVATILYSPERRRAVVDGRIVGVGDKVGTATVVDIQPNAVVIESAENGRVVLLLRRPGGRP
jgi:hypothetical protein